MNKLNTYVFKVHFASTLVLCKFNCCKENQKFPQMVPLQTMSVLNSNYWLGFLVGSVTRDLLVWGKVIWRSPAVLFFGGVEFHTVWFCPVLLDVSNRKWE